MKNELKLTTEPQFFSLHITHSVVFFVSRTLFFISIYCTPKMERVGRFFTESFGVERKGASEDLLSDFKLYPGR